MIKNQTLPISTRVTLEELAAIKMSGETVADFLKNAIEEKLVMENADFVYKKLQDLENDKKVLLLKKGLIDKKAQNFKKIPNKEIGWLIETKKILEKQPLFIDGRISLYLNIFKKPYKLSKPEFFKLIQEADVQQEERMVLDNCKQG